MNDTSNATRATPSSTYRWGVLYIGDHTSRQLGWLRTKKAAEGFARTQIQLRGFVAGELCLARWCG